ncbi:MAG: TetR/AcrR family transcriptional regulator [Oscillospiraceae bacterium]|nr:TetR/AcrR family transcriptional regulator [Oscillospiraceae bacterium]
MPPKPKFTRGQIIDAALALIRDGGFAALTARNLGKRLGSSSQPIFTVFQNMDEVQQETRKAARNLYCSYVLGKGADSAAFRRVDYIHFAKDEPMLFAMMFMTADKSEYSMKDILSGVFTNTEALIAAVQEEYRLSREDAHTLCSSMWIFIHGIACLCAAGMTQFVETEVEALVNNTFEDILRGFAHAPCDGAIGGKIPPPGKK